MGDIARITVKKEQGLLRSMTRDVPAMQAHAILGVHEDIFIHKPPLRRCLVKRCVREKDHRGLLQIHTTIQQDQSKQQEQDVFYHSVFHVGWYTVKARLLVCLLAILDSDLPLPKSQTLLRTFRP